MLIYCIIALVTIFALYLIYPRKRAISITQLISELESEMDPEDLAVVNECINEVKGTTSSFKFRVHQDKKVKNMHQV